MDPTTDVVMPESEIAEFLHRQGTGVLSLARDGEAYAIPVSFGYDDEEPAIYVRLGYAPGSYKRPFVSETERVAFVVYDEVDATWTSVIALGRLEEVVPDSIDSAVVRALKRVDPPLLSLFGRQRDEIEFTMNKLVIDELTGRRSSASIDTDGPSER